jgi:rod shape-determining protein MreD
VAQTTLWPELAILGVTPDTTLILIVSYAMLRGEIEGALFGLAGGFVADVFGGVHLGIYALLGFLVGYVSGKPFRSFFKDNYFLPFFVVLGMSVVYQLAVYVLQFMFFGHLNFWYYVYAIILPKTVYTAALAIPLYSLMHAANRRLEEYENKRRVFKENND